MQDYPFIYFDGAVAFGHQSGIVRVELAATVLEAKSDGSLGIRNVGAAHLRCSVAAARDLMQALARAVELADRPVVLPSSGSVN